MSLAVARSEGVTVVTLTSDTSSACPPLCQLLGALCYSPNLCSVSRRLVPRRGGPQAALGALWIITGLLHIGLGVLLITSRWGVYNLRDTLCPVWMGVLCLLFGVSAILTERQPRPFLVLLNGLLNLLGAALSIFATVLYSSDTGYGYYSYCERDQYNYDYNYDHRTTTEAPDERPLLERCQEAKYIQQALTKSILAVLIVLSLLNLCLGISSATFSFKAIKQGLSKKGNKPLKEDKAAAE